MYVIELQTEHYHSVCSYHHKPQKKINHGGKNHKSYTFLDLFLFTYLSIVIILQLFCLYSSLYSEAESEIILFTIYSHYRVLHSGVTGCLVSSKAPIVLFYY